LNIIPAGPASGVSFPWSTKHMLITRYGSFFIFAERSPYPGSPINPLHNYLLAAGRWSMSPVVTESTRITRCVLALLPRAACSDVR